MNETKDDFLKSDSDHSDIDRNGLREDMAFIRGLVHERDLSMLNTDIGEGRALGDSKVVIKHVRDAAKHIRTIADGITGDRGLYRDTDLGAAQRRDLRGEAQGIIAKALMTARAEWIRRSGKPLDGY